MKTYLVGGAVRDRLLGHPGVDADWVVVGATPDQMLAAGYRAVGQDFPVFLHPHTGEEHALARTERKTAPGYRGFTFHAAADVTLEQDLARRDLTINAIAMDPQTGEVIDPWGGRRDLQARVLRHVGPAFAEDPVRLLRVARFAARFDDFSVHPDTLALMRRMVQAGEVDALVPERVWQELARGLMTHRPSRMFRTLRECGALAVLLPEVDRLWGVPQPPVHHPEVDTGEHLMLVLDMAARLQAPLAVRFACLGHDLGKADTPADRLPRHLGHEQHSVAHVQAVSARLKVPVECRELALAVAREHGNVHASGTFGAAAIVRLLERCDAFRRPERFAGLLLACECDARGRTGLEDRAYAPRPRLTRALERARAVPTAALAAEVTARGQAGPAVARAIHAARCAAVAAGLVADGEAGEPEEPTAPGRL